MNSARRQPAPISAPALTKAEREAPTVLIVDDESPIADALGDIIEEAGYRAITATNGRLALELARQQRVVFVITDYMMPYVNGAELILALREDAEAQGRPAPPIALMSAVAEQVDMSVTGADVIISKPFDIAEIEEVLRQFMGPVDSFSE
ncbi:MAG TPA: response regulator [Ktedonobacterales bacterium]